MNGMLFDDLYREPLAKLPPSPAHRDGGAKALARRDDPSTSREAAAKAVDSGLVAGHEEMIRAIVGRGGGWTDFEIAREIKHKFGAALTNVQISRRVSAMKDLKRCDDSLKRSCHVTAKVLTTVWMRSTFEEATP